MHSAIEYIFEHPEYAAIWHNNSNYLAFLSVKNEQELIDLIIKAEEKGIIFSIFREPDIGNQITAIALAPGTKTKKLLNRLPLALK